MIKCMSLPKKTYGHVQRQSYFTTESMGTNGPIGT